MEDFKKDVPYIVYESETARHERTVKRLLTALLVTILLMVGTNMAWLYVWNQYDFSSTEYTFGNVTSTAIVTVPKGCCFSVAVRYTDATTDDAATTPTPVIEVQNANLTITRIA